MEKREARRLISNKGEDRLELAVRAETVPAQIILGRDHGDRRLLVDRKFTDEPQYQAGIGQLGKTDRDRVAHGAP